MLFITGPWYARLRSTLISYLVLISTLLKIRVISGEQVRRPDDRSVALLNVVVFREYNSKSRLGSHHQHWYTRARKRA